MKAAYTVNLQAVARARQLIDARQYVLKSVWSDVQPSAEDENAFLESHSWEEYAQWHLALTEGAGDQTKARYAFVYGRLPPPLPHGLDRLPVPGRRMAPQAGRAGRP
jgi:hypothetical protein